MQIHLSSLVSAKSGSPANYGRGLNAPEDIHDYLGRLVDSHNNLHTVVRVEPSNDVTCTRDGTPVPGAARLFIAREVGADGRPFGRWVEACDIAAPGLTVLSWCYRTDHRENPATCEALYLSVLEADRLRVDEHRKSEEERAAKAAECARNWQKFAPEWAKGYLVAEHREDKSDSITDYFGYSTTETVFLGFSKSDRNNFAEMRKLATTFLPTEHLAGPEGVEYRENYSGGGGYYLGDEYGRYSGWVIRKRSLRYGTPALGNIVDFSYWIARQENR